MDPIHPIRQALVPVLSEGTWDDIRRDHDRVQMPWREDLGPGWGKPRYVESALASLSTEAVLALARRCLEAFPNRANITVQDALWRHEASGRMELSEISRRALADWFDGKRLHPDEDPTTFLARFALPEAGTGGAPVVGYTAGGRLVRHGTYGTDFYASFGDPHSEPAEPIQHHQLLDVYGFRWWPDQRVFLMLEALVHPATRKGAEQQSWVNAINAITAVDGFALREVEQLSGHPIFAVTRQQGTIHRRPKNLIFASKGPKPELGFSDAIDNDIVILSNAEHVLVFEDAIGDEGLTWPSLGSWWARRRQIDDASARKNLGMRLVEALSSPPKLRFFKAYFKCYAPSLGERLPALLPQVYLHFDPATLRQLRQRGMERRFLVQRMDFLMLLPGNARVVLEVDGQQHYATGTGDAARPSPQVYAETVRSDRELRLAGYEVYRFGGAELTENTSPRTVTTFFDGLFVRHGILPNP